MKRPVVMILTVVLVAMGGVGFWLVTRGESEEDRVLQSFDALIRSVETRDPTLLERYLHADYDSWGGDRASAIELFTRAIDRYTDASIDVREQQVRIEPSGNEASMEFEWTYRATLEGDIRSVSRDQMDRIPSGMMPWEEARAVFVKDSDGRWTLQIIDTQVPQFRR